VELAEEATAADPARADSRRALPDGQILDLSGYDEFGVILIYRTLPDGSIEFTDFLINRPN